MAVAGQEADRGFRVILARLLPLTIVLSVGLAGSIEAEQAGTVRRIVEIEELPNTIGSLKGVKPLLPDVSEYIADKAAAQQLGKALFWDIQVGSQGVACASCHFHAGADIRTKNQVDPGIRGGDVKFGSRWQAAGSTGPNKQLTAVDLPFHRLTNPSDRESNVAFDSNDIISSQGSFGGSFVSSILGAPQGPNAKGIAARARPKESRLRANENCIETYDPQNNPFHANNLIYRKVEPRQTPTAINAVFNHRQFWDGRANNQFNGVDPFGPRTFQPLNVDEGVGNANARGVGTLVAGGPSLRLEQRLIENASLASQAVGPPLSDFEMSCGGKTFADLGRKLIDKRPLAYQKIDRNDSVLGTASGLLKSGAPKGIDVTYGDLIERAFNKKFWVDQSKVTIAADGSVTKSTSGFTQKEHNFSLFWGLAIQEYESLLISDDASFDRARDGKPTAMSDQARAGENVFLNQGKCVGCHFGPAMSGATMTSKDGPNPKVLEHMRVGNGSTAFYDTGFYNIGVRPSSEDIGAGGTDPYGFDLSYSRGYKWLQSGKKVKSPDRFAPNPCKWILQFWPCSEEPVWSDPKSTERDAVDGSFKVPVLRNVGLNPPYFHDGGQGTLKDVVRFYNRGGDRRGPLEKDSSGLSSPNAFGQVNDSNLDPDIGDVTPVNPKQNNALGLTETEMDDLVQFLLSLTDERVACHSGVFDHPELPLPMGQLDEQVAGSQLAQDIVRTLPAVGKNGLKAIGKPCFPNSGALFGSVNPLDPRPLQGTFEQILGNPDADHTRVLAGRLAQIVAAVNGIAGAPGAVGVAGAAGVSGAIGAAGLAGATGAAGAVGTAGVAGGLGGTAAAGLAATISAAATTNAIAVPTKPPAVPAPVFSAATSDIHAFSLIGFIQSATVSGSECRNLPARQWGGSAVVNGIAVVIPCNTRLQMPAATYAWAELFPSSVGGVGTDQTPLTLAAGGTSSSGGFQFPSTEIRIEGNIVGGRFIAGLVFISQQSLNSGTGFITGFDYAKGVIYVGGKANGPAQIKLQLNDPAGRYSRGQSPDPRFQVDDTNPTVRAETGYPMCVPRSDPAGTDDPLCPLRNRPLAAAGCRNFGDAHIGFITGRDLVPQPGQKYCSSFVMGNPATAIATEPLSTQQAPFQIGDMVTYAGTLLKGDGQGPGGSDTISAHTVTAHVGIFTEPGTLPVYLAIGEFRIGNFNPVTVINGVVQELQDRLILEAMVTDVTSIVDIYLVDIDPATAKETQRWVTTGAMTGGVGGLGSNGHIIDGGITTQITGAQPGRVRLRANKVLPGLLDSPTRNVRVVARSLCDPANVNGTAPLLGQLPVKPVACLDRAPAANGLKSGHYSAPTIDFILPENVTPGDPPVPNNFWDLGFLVNGEGKGTGRLAPTPW